MRYEQMQNSVLERLRRELPSDLFYHNLDHTLNVLNAAVEIAGREGIVDEKSLTLLKTAALFHDLGHVERFDDNECVGCRLVKEALPGFGYSQNDIKTVSDMILATEIPQNPKTKLAEILCDADLDYLGRDDFIPISEKLRKELSAHGKSFSNVEWIRFEIAFLEGHEYFTKSERESRNPVKQMNLERLKLEIVKASPNISRNS